VVGVIKVWSKEVVETKSYLQGGLTTLRTETRIFTIRSDDGSVDRIREKIGRIVGILRRNKGNENKIQKA